MSVVCAEHESDAIIEKDIGDREVMFTFYKTRVAVDHLARA